MHGACADCPQVTAVWDDILGWLRGDKLLTAPPSAPSALAETVAEFETEDVAGAPRRMGCAFLVGREAGGGPPAVAAAAAKIEKRVGWRWLEKSPEKSDEIYKKKQRTWKSRWKRR